VTSATFNPLDQCPSSRCKTNAKGGMLHLQTRGCKFQKFQEVRVQELAEEVPIGSIPRTLNVQMKGELTRSLAPGDVVDLTGIFLPIQFTGFKVRAACAWVHASLRALVAIPAQLFRRAAPLRGDAWDTMRGLATQRYTSRTTRES
jgi:DNA replication licensing factor MCM7